MAGGRRGPDGALAGRERPAARRIEPAGDVTRADVAFRRACEGASLLYRGDWRNARQLLAALTRRLEERSAKRPQEKGELDLRGAFLAHRQHQSTVHQVTSRLLVALDGRWRVELKAGPGPEAGVRGGLGPAEGPALTPLRGLLGMVGAHEWRQKGVEVAAIAGGSTALRRLRAGARRVRRPGRRGAAGKGGARLRRRGWDGVLSVLLARRGVPEIVATDLDARAVACAQENVDRFRLSDRVRIEQRDLFPRGWRTWWCSTRRGSRAAAHAVERAIFDPDSELLLRFLRELPEHLAPGGRRGWSSPTWRSSWPAGRAAWWRRRRARRTSPSAGRPPRRRGTRSRRTRTTRCTRRARAR